MKKVVLLLSLLLLVSCGVEEIEPDIKPSKPQTVESATEIKQEVAETAPEKEVQKAVDKKPEIKKEEKPVATPEEKPTLPPEVETEDAPEAESKTYCSVSVTCEKAVGKKENLPEDGVILAATQVEFTEGESAFEVIKRCLEEQNIPFEYREDTVFNSIYIEGIGGLFEKDCGAYSGWMYKVNGSPPTYASSEYVVKEGDVIEFYYSC